MNIDDLRKLLVLGQQPHLQTSAKQLNITAGALSKVLKKVEESLHTRLFDRVGRQLVLNHDGKKYLEYAQHLVFEYDQMCSEFTGDKARINISVAGPAVLFSILLKRLNTVYNAQDTDMRFNSVYEGEAITQVKKGLSQLALVTDEAKSDWQLAGFNAVKLTSSANVIVVSASHPLANQNNISIGELLKYSFVCPNTSPFCGRKRGQGSDGWPDEILPRLIQYRLDDIHAQLTLIRAGEAVGFLPDIIELGDGLVQIDATKIPELPVIKENVCLIYQPSLSNGWLMQLIDKL